MGYQLDDALALVGASAAVEGLRALIAQVRHSELYGIQPCFLRSFIHQRFECKDINRCP